MDGQQTSRLPRRLVIAAALAAALAVGLGAVPTAEAAPTRCPQHFVRGEAPDVLNPKLKASTYPLCFSEYAVLYSGITRTPLYAAEHLTRQQVADARELRRENAFHPEPALPPDARSTLADYQRSGFDRGHMAPSGDMPDPVAQEESFSLANMVPQDPDKNRGLWEAIESAVREWALGEGELYVVTGPLFRGQELQTLNGRVLVPTDLFKAVYDPAHREAAVYLTSNTEGWAWRRISIAELEQLSGIDVFPALPDSVKARAGPLPTPEPHRSRARTSSTAPRDGGPEGLPPPSPPRTGSIEEPAPADAGRWRGVRRYLDRMLDELRSGR